MAQTAIILHGTWTSITGVVNEPNLLVNSVGMKPSRDKSFKKGASSRADERARYTNPTLTIVLDVVIVTKAVLGALGVGKAVTAGLANFAALWREHDPSEGKLILDDVDEKMEVDADEVLTGTLTVIHKPFITA